MTNPKGTSPRQQTPLNSSEWLVKYPWYSLDALVSLQPLFKPASCCLTLSSSCEGSFAFQANYIYFIVPQAFRCVVLLFADSLVLRVSLSVLPKIYYPAVQLYWYVALPGTKVNLTAGKCAIVIQLQKVLHKCKMWCYLCIYSTPNLIGGVFWDAKVLCEANVKGYTVFYNISQCSYFGHV